MNKQKKIILTILTGIMMLLSAGMPASEIKEQTSRPGEYLENWLRSTPDTHNTLIILDIDDTILTSPQGQWLGRSEMFYGLMKDILIQHPDWKKWQAADYLDPLLVAMYPRVPLSLTDLSLPQIIELLKARGIHVIGMTSRGLATRNVTLWQLNEANIHFSETGPLENINLSDGRISLMEKGVVFVSHGNRKGEVLKALMNKPSELFTDIQKVLMIDDKKRHLIDMGETLTDISFTPVLCTFPETQDEYQHSEAIQQLKLFLEQWKYDAVIRNMINTDPFTQSLLTQSLQKQN